MTIDEGRTRDRGAVAWFGSVVPKEARSEFVARQFHVDEQPCTDDQLVDPLFLSGLAAVIFTQDAQKPNQIVRDLQTHGQRLLDWDCRVVARTATNPSSGANIADLLGRVTVNQRQLPVAGLPAVEGKPVQLSQTPYPHIHIFSQDIPWSVIADFVVEHPPDKPPYTTLRIVGPGKESITPDAEILIKRAFEDCVEVYLVSIDGGHSGVPVFRAYAELKDGQHGRWPLPYFVKLGERNKIYTEYWNYQNKVDPYIPFHLGPHLIPKRCHLGALEGIIVGDWVDESEALTGCANTGRAAAAISCLFDRTLYGWHREAEKKDMPIADTLGRYFPAASRFAETRLERAREFGATSTPDDLKERFQRCTSVPVLMGPIHGDLHAKNVHVRAIDAIVIDFLRHNEGPLVYDPACLEAGLLVEGFSNDSEFSDKDEKLLRANEWLASIEALYDHIPLSRAPVHPQPKNPSAWFHACVRQIRLYAQQMQCEPCQYAAALALALLIKASKDRDVLEPEASRRAGAYVLAERILKMSFPTTAASTTQ
jgi:Ternary complex associated domain 9